MTEIEQARIKAQLKLLKQFEAEFKGELPECEGCKVQTLLAGDGERRFCQPCAIVECEKAGVLVGIWK